MTPPTEQRNKMTKTIDTTEIRAELLREYTAGKLGMFASQALMGNAPQFVAEALIRASARVGILSALAGSEDPMVLVRYIDKVRAMVPHVISGGISPEGAVICAL